MTDNVTNLPHADIVLDLDTEERTDTRPVFAANVGGRRIVMQDPEDLDWQDLYEIQTPQDFLHACLSPEDRKHLFEQKLPAWKLGKLISAFMNHYGLEDKLRELRRQQQRGF
jgi:hypothetical protein